jgi:hypothetical protein
MAGIVIAAGAASPGMASCRLGSFVVQEDTANARAPAIKAVRNGRMGRRLADLNARFPHFSACIPRAAGYSPPRAALASDMPFTQIQTQTGENTLHPAGKTIFPRHQTIP